MAIENYPVWPFEPNWSSSMTEVLEWLADVMTSPTGSEQRRSWRFFPRQTFEYTVAASGGERTLLDNLLITYSAQRWYLPLWHDVNVIEQSQPAGVNTLTCSTVETSRMTAGSVAALINDSVYRTELVEIQAVSPTTVTFVSPTTLPWPAGSRLFPVRIAKLTDQPVMSKRSDRVVTSEVRFQVLETPHDDGDDPPSVLADAYRGFLVLPVPPDDRQALDHGIERLLVELDNQTSFPTWQDTANRAFTYQKYSWVIEGRADLYQFEALLQMLRGRAIPLWIPTFMEDLTLAMPIGAGDQTIVAQPSGFTGTGGPRPDRQDIMIETETDRFYRRIAGAAMDSQGRETILLDQPIPTAIAPDQVFRICFMTLMRQSQDSVSIEHQTDSDGVATAQTTFRSAPDTRVAGPASF